MCVGLLTNAVRPVRPNLGWSRPISGRPCPTAGVSEPALVSFVPNRVRTQQTPIPTEFETRLRQNPANWPEGNIAGHSTHGGEAESSAMVLHAAARLRRKNAALMHPDNSWEAARSGRCSAIVQALQRARQTSQSARPNSGWRPELGWNRYNLNCGWLRTPRNWELESA